MLLACYVLAGTAEVPFHGDESTQIYMSRDYAYQFIQHDLNQIAYSDTPSNAAEQELRLINGTVNKYLIGLAWHLDGMSISNINEQWDWGADWNYNQQNNHAPTETLLLASRWPSALLLAAGVAVVFALGQTLGGRWTPYVASLYYALNPALLLNGRRAMMEGSFIFFSLLVLLVAIWLLQHPSLPRAILLGIVSGFALASKHTAVFTVVVVFTAVLLYLIYQSARSEDDSSVVDYVLLPYLGFAAIAAFGVFFALNPVWWGDPAARAQNVLQLRQSLLAGQTATFGGYAQFGDQFSGFLRQGLIVYPQYFEISGWDVYLADQISRYEASVWRGVSIGGSVVGALVLCGIMAAGVWEWVKVLVPQRLRNRRWVRWTMPDDEAVVDVYPAVVGAHWLVGTWMLMMVFSTLLLTPLEWQRYYLPLYPAIGLLIAVGVDALAKHNWNALLSRRADEPVLSDDDSRPDTLPELV